MKARRRAPKNRKTAAERGSAEREDAASKPPKHDQKFFLALARRGKDEWNRWRDENPDVEVTFAGVDFREQPNAAIDFSQFRFGDEADFSGCRFGDGPMSADDDEEEDPTGPPFEPGMAKFRRAIFGDTAGFRCAIFGNRADLSGATFGDDADFVGANFGTEVNFAGATFGSSADFFGAIFAMSANLSRMSVGPGFNMSGTHFGHFADLSGTTFEVKTYFSGVIFDDYADLAGATFGTVSFDAMSEETWRKWLERHFERDSSQQRNALGEAHGALHRDDIGRDRFKTISFAGTRFGDHVSFKGRRFDGPCDLTGATFEQLADFDGCEGVACIDLTGARIGFAGTVDIEGLDALSDPLDDPERDAFPQTVGRWLRPLSGIQVPGWTADSSVALKLRTLRQLAEDTKNHDLERDLYIAERKAERGIYLARYLHEAWNPRVWPRLFTHLFWIAAMGIYWLLSDYGRSFVRPLIALVASAFIFQAAFSTTLKPPPGADREGFRRAVSAFAVSNAVPFVGALTLDKDVRATIICRGMPTDAETARQRNLPVCASTLPPLRFQLLVLGQSIFSALCVFFIALALRNYFKLR